MSLAQDASSPAAVLGTGDGTTITTAPFSPPSGSLLVALVSGEYSDGAISAVLSDTGHHTWTRMAIATGSPYGGMAGIWTTYLSSAPGSITVTATMTGLGGGRMLDVKVITGADPAQSASQGWAAAYTSLAVGTGAITLTTTVSSSLVYGISNAPTRQTNPTAWPGTTTILATHSNTDDATEAVSWKSSSFTGTPGSTTMGVSWAASTVGNVAAFEIVPLGATSGSPTMPTFVDGTVPHASDLNTINTNITNLFNLTQGGVRWAPYVPGGKGPVKPMCVLTMSTPKVSVPSGSNNYVHWDTALINSDNSWSSMNDPFVIMHTAGLWRIHFQGQVAGLASNAEIEAVILYNGTTYPGNAIASGNANGSGVGCSATIQVTSGSFICCQLNQFSGASGTYGYMQLVAEWLGP